MVTNRLVKAGRAAGATKRWRSGEAMLLLMDLESMLAPVGGNWRGGGGEGGREQERLLLYREKGVELSRISSHAMARIHTQRSLRFRPWRWQPYHSADFA